MNNIGILEEEDKGQDYRFYIYNFETEEAVSWFNTYQEAENLINGVKKIMGEL